MNIYYAPMEGIAGYIYRNAHHKVYGGVDRYYAPFIGTNMHGPNAKSLKDVLPENNPGITIIPQLLTNNAQQFTEYEKALAELGYTEVNLNLGCPSKTVTAKGKGSGMLVDPFVLDRFLNEIYSNKVVDISIKTRIGETESSEFPDLMDIFNKYPVKELTIHARTQKMVYGGKPDMEAFSYGYEKALFPVVFNGNVTTPEDINNLAEKYPNMSAVMIGRGFFTDPELAEKYKNSVQNNSGLDLSRFKQFHDIILASYLEKMSGETQVLIKMKELWSFWSAGFEGKDKVLKKIKKSQRIVEYKSLADEMFR